MNIPFTRLTDFAITPRKATSHAAAYDLFLPQDTVVTVYQNSRVLAPTGIAVAIPESCAGLILPRSGNALKLGVTVLNTPGLIDPDYRGEVKVILTNLSDQERPITFIGGDRIAQLLIVPTLNYPLMEVDYLMASERGEGGFGSTGQ